MLQTKYEFMHRLNLQKSEKILIGRTNELELGPVETHSKHLTAQNAHKLNENTFQTIFTFGLCIC